ncbi:MAG: enoyl-CoA hydratase-related protein [Candidatus Berkiella sp.]
MIFGFSSILLQIDEQGVATLTLNRPDVHNAFDDKMIAEMTKALGELAKDPTVKILVIKSVGKHFSAGGDIAWMQKMIEADELANLKDADALAQLMYQLSRFRKPTLAVVQGNAYGGGVGLVACAHIAIAANNAQFCFSEVKLGLIPAVISPYIVRAIGQRNARAYFLTAKPFDATRAQQMGLCHHVVTPEQLEATANETIATLLKNGPKALLAVNELIDNMQTLDINEERVRMTAKTIASLRISAEGQEGLNAFLQRREPSWAKTR